MLSNEIAAYLASQGIGTLGTDVFYSHMPDVDNCVVVFDTGGFDGQLWLNIDYPTVQIRARNLTASGAYNKLASVYSLLHGLHNINLTNTHLIDCVGIQSAPLDIGQDEKQRREFTINFRCTIVNPTINRE